ncbi:MAG: hypothetical protein PUP92_39840 [Rhizonema sp. PD38]|nr:hypothetical protein [Rhizonema sp. PD38]
MNYSQHECKITYLFDLQTWLPWRGQVLQVGRAFRQSPTEGNPPAALAHQRTAQVYCGLFYRYSSSGKGV